MSNSFVKQGSREDNTKKLTMYVQDDENTMMYKPIDMHGNKFFGTVSKLYTMQKMLNVEIQTKYQNDYSAYFKASLERGSLPICFDSCIGDVQTGAGLNSDEKNCLRECYLKRVSAKDDFQMLTT